MIMESTITFQVCTVSPIILFQLCVATVSEYNDDVLLCKHVAVISYLIEYPINLQGIS